MGERYRYIHTLIFNIEDVLESELLVIVQSFHSDLFGYLLRMRR